MKIQWEKVWDCCFHCFVKVYQSPSSLAGSQHTQIPCKEDGFHHENTARTAGGSRKRDRRRQSSSTQLASHQPVSSWFSTSRPGCSILLRLLRGFAGIQGCYRTNTSGPSKSYSPHPHPWLHVCLNSLLDQFRSTWECPLLSLLLPMVYQPLTQRITMNRTCTLSRSPWLCTWSWEKENVSGIPSFKIKVV